MKFKHRDEPVFTSEPHYDLLDGGYIDPDELLEDPADAEHVKAAIETVKRFLDEAESAGVLEVG